MAYTARQALALVEQSGVDIVRLAFCDPFGAQRGVDVMRAALPHALEGGVPFDASGLWGCMGADAGDLRLVIDPSTLCILPESVGGVRAAQFFCDLCRRDHSAFEGDGRQALKASVQKLRGHGFDCRFAPAISFYLFERDPNGEPTKIPLDRAGLFNIAPEDRGEGVRREICAALGVMGVETERAHHAKGPGQQGIALAALDALKAADHSVVLKGVVRAAAARRNLFASFMPLPLAKDEGNEFRLNIALFREENNLFSGEGGAADADALHFSAGVLRRLGEMALFLNPLTNSYARLHAPAAQAHIRWSRRNPLAPLCIPQGGARMELRAPDPCCNPYLAFSLLIEAGLEGVLAKTPLPPPVDIDLYQADAAVRRSLGLLPRTLADAVGIAQQSAFIRAAIPAPLLRGFIDAGRAQWQAYCAQKDREAFEHRAYRESV